jgi:purine-nucleoside phosphorylase
MLNRIKEAVDFLQKKVFLKPEIGIILGTGLGGLINELEIIQSYPFSAIPNFPVSTVTGHNGQLIFGKMSGKNIVAMQGRIHYYEGYSMQEIAFPVRVMKFLGIHLLILSNASGGLNPTFNIGDLMIIEDHINLMGNNPLIGRNEDELGPRFPDMSNAYDPELIKMAINIARKFQIPLQHGIYAAVSGPTYETPAEYHYLHTIGADAVGMSTVPEVIAAHHMGLQCIAFSVISDLGVPGKIVKITHHDVVTAASSVEPKMTKILKELIGNLD